MIVLYYQTKTPISFGYKLKLNPSSFIQPSEILPVELIRTHHGIQPKSPLVVGVEKWEDRKWWEDGKVGR